MSSLAGGAGAEDGHAAQRLRRGAPRPEEAADHRRLGRQQRVGLHGALRPREVRSNPLQKPVKAMKRALTELFLASKSDLRLQVSSEMDH